LYPVIHSTALCLSHVLMRTHADPPWCNLGCGSGKVTSYVVLHQRYMVNLGGPLKWCCLPQSKVSSLPHCHRHPWPHVYPVSRVRGIQFSKAICIAQLSGMSHCAPAARKPVHFKFTPETRVGDVLVAWVCWEAVPDTWPGNSKTPVTECVVCAWNRTRSVGRRHLLPVHLPINRLMNGYRKNRESNVRQTKTNM